MSINGDCIYCSGHSTDEEWDAWNGECQWCGELDVEWERSGGKDKGEAEDDDCDYNELDRMITGGMKMMIKNMI